MSQIVVKRPPRSLPPEVPTEELRLEPPPELPRGQQEGMLMQILPMLGMGSSVVFFFMPNMPPFMRIMGVLMLVSTVGMVVAQIVRHRRGTQGQVADVRRDYLKYLAQTRRTVRKTARAQRDAQLYLHPSPEQLWSVVAEGSRLWERRVGDHDFCQVRVGLGAQQLATPLVAPDTAPVDELEPLCAGAMQQFLAVHGSLDGLPMAVSLRAFYHVTVSGEPESACASARAMVAQLVTLHSPEDLMVAVVAAPGAVARWDWTKWLPHTQVPGQVDGAGTKRLFGDDLGELEQLLRNRLEGRPRFSRESQPVLDQPHIVVVLDGGMVPPDSLFAAPEGLQGVTIIEVVAGELDEPRGGLSVVVHPGRLRLQSGAGYAYEGVPDTLSPEAAEALARQLAPLCVGGGDDDEPLLANLDFTDLLNLGDAAAVDVARTWRPRSTAERLRVPIGVGEDGSPVMLDLKEAAQEGMGPHGLCVGATGSGKSELLRTLVLGLAVTHSSETLNFVLADFKGGATFAGMSQMPHVAAVITNLADDLTLVDRMGDAIRGELQRRQELLRSAGNYANIHDYEKARAAGAALEPLASLVLVIDEFSELLSAKPDFIDMFIQIGRIGRSLGVHLLLASQRLEEGRLRGLDTYLSYRIGLRTFSAAESRTALGVPDAYHLPSVPGSGYLKFGTDEMVRFKAAYVSGTYRTGSPQLSADQLPIERRPAVFTAAPVPVVYAAPDPARLAASAAPEEDDALADTVLDVIVRRLEGQGVPAHQVWLPPLDQAPPLDQLLPGLAPTADRGFTATEYARPGGLVVPLGLIDKPFEQRREVLYQDFSGAAGHLMVVGGPQSGKSTLLRALISSFALTHTPWEVQFYGLDFGGGGMSALADLPHVGGIASRLDPERVRRTVAEVMGVLNRREEFFRANNIDSIATYRRKRAAGELPGEPWGDVFLVIDGWGTFRNDHEGLDEMVTDIVTRGLGYGVHVVISTTRWMEVRASVKDLVLGRLELRLGDTMDSEFDRRVAANVPTGVPGRGQVPEKLHFMGALPRIDGSSNPRDLSEGTAAFVQTVRSAWSGPSAPAVRLLPRSVPADRLPKGFEFPRQGVAIGIDETNLEPVFVDFETDPFFLIFGESESGKTNLLRLLTKQIAERYSPDEAKLVVGDYRRSLLGALPEQHVLEYAPMGNSLQMHMEALAGVFERRQPPENVTPQQLRDRSWWSGPQIFIVIDDYDLVSTSAGNPLAPLAEYLPFARDTGIRFIIARQTAGASRAMYEAFMQRIKELGAQGVVMSGDPQEGDLLGMVRPRPLPPGRGYFVSRRGGASMIQLGRMPDA
ncbi:type VII secretion protein EccC [Streptomyces thermolilacinus]|uniref:Type VII secretion protein EccC n=1 Tax=Streptomyces thermolilacinus SPC6 TaxID=1306406 RepID=A0A1D3DP99_9ACTN|nr:type VII secretion protein EccC [Streptomyces thermolilacinus]OEJ94128.1 type VII secretion protein EccC [Streptomyces thermolilacinus SPC6]